MQITLGPQYKVFWVDRINAALKLLSMIVLIIGKYRIIDRLVHTFLSVLRKNMNAAKPPEQSKGFTHRTTQLRLTRVNSFSHNSAAVTYATITQWCLFQGGELYEITQWCIFQGVELYKITQWCIFQGGELYKITQWCIFQAGELYKITQWCIFQAGELYKITQWCIFQGGESYTR